MEGDFRKELRCQLGFEEGVSGPGAERRLRNEGISKQRAVCKRSPPEVWPCQRLLRQPTQMRHMGEGGGEEGAWLGEASSRK